MKSTLMTTSATGLSRLVPAFIAPNAAAQGTALPLAGTAAVEAAAAGVRTTDLPGSPPRDAPV